MNEKLILARQNLYKSSEKILVDNTIAGTWKTDTALLYSIRNYDHTLSFLNDHNLVHEKHWDLIKFGNNLNLIQTLFGSTHKFTIPEKLRWNVNVDYLCPYYNNWGFKMKRDNGYLLNEYCREICPMGKNHTCPAKKWKRESFQNIKNNNYDTEIMMLVKSYIHTTIPDTIIENFGSDCIIIDENFNDLLYSEIGLHAGMLEGFRSRVLYNMIKWKGFKEFFGTLYDLHRNIYLDLTNRHIKTNQKNKNISKMLTAFSGSWSVKDMNIENEKFKRYITDDYETISKMPNMINRIIKICEDIELNNQIKYSAVEERSGLSYSYFIDNKQRIQDLINKTKRLIITDMLSKKEDIINLFPDLEDNVAEIDSKFIVIPQYYNDIFINKLNYKLEHPNTRKFSYPILSLKNFSKYKKGYTSTYYNLIKKIIFFMEYEAIKCKKFKGLLISHSSLSVENKKKLENIIKKYKINFDINYYKNIEGKGYIDKDYLIILGDFNIPYRIRKIFSKMFNISMTRLDEIHGVGQFLQAIGRLRLVLRMNSSKEDLPDILILTNSFVGYFDREIDFEKIYISEREQNILNFIEKTFLCTTKQVENHLNLPKKSILNILHSLVKKDYLDFTKVKTGKKGRESFSWNVIDTNS